VHACVLHMPALLTDRGVSAQGAAMASSIVGFFVAMLVAAWLMTRVGPYRYAAEKAHEEHSVAPLQAESLG